MIDTKSKSEIRTMLESAGSRFKGESACTCPFHLDTNPSAGIYQTEGGSWRFKCQVCGDNMDAVGIESRLTGRSVEDIVKGNKGIEKNTTVLTESEIRHRFSVESGWKYLHEYRNEFSVITHFVACKYEGEKKKFLQMKRYGFNFTMGNSGKRPIFRLDKIKDCDTIVFVEGEKCVIALEYIGIMNSTTCMGGAKSVSTADLLPLKGKRIIIWPDKDSPGMEYAADLKKALEQIDCKVAMVDLELYSHVICEGGDVADYIKSMIKDYSKEEIKSDLEATFNEIHFDGFFDVYKSTHIADLKSGVLKSINIGWDCLEKTKWLIGGSVTVVCAKPGIGKTWFVHDLSIRAHRAGIKVANIQLEESKNYHMTRIMTSMLGIKLTDPDSVTDESIAILEKNYNLMNEISPIIVVPEFDKCTLLNVAKIVKEKAESGCKLIIVDSVSVAEKEKQSWDDDQRFINIVKHEVAKHKIRLVIVTHPNGLQEKTPSLDSLSGGKAYQRLSQTVLWLSDHSGTAHAWKHNEDPFSGAHREGNRTIRMLKGRNASEHLSSATILFNFAGGRFDEIGFCDLNR